MAKDRIAEYEYVGRVRRMLVTVLGILLVGMFLVWRIDSPRAERLRAAVIDRVVPSFDWALVPVTKGADMIGGFQSYIRIFEQNQELRRELQTMKGWKEAAVQLEQQNAKLLAQNNVRLDPKLTSVSGVVLADAGSPFRQSVLLNVGERDGIVDGWATTDGLGLVGRIAGVGKTTSRVLLLTDASSRVPVTVQSLGMTAMLVGDNTPFPPIEFIDAPDRISPGDRVVSAGDGGVFPAGILVGYVVRDTEGQLRVQPSADFARLDFLRVLRSQNPETIGDSVDIVGPVIPPAPVGESPLPAPEPTADPVGADG